MIDPGNGIHPAIPFEDYLSIRRLNASDLVHMDESPAHFIYNQTEKRKDTKALRRGRAVSLALFEPELYRTSFAVYEDRKAGKEWESFKKAMGPGVDILTEAEGAEVKALTAAVRASEMARRFVTGGKGEVSICWTHTTPEVGGVAGYSVDCKGRLDFIPDALPVISDVKTARSARPQPFGRQAFQLQYHVKAAWYLDGWKKLTGEEREFYLVAVEAKPPHVVQVYRVTDAALKIGRETYRTWLDRLVFCRKEARWPGYAEAPMDLEIPDWLLDDENDLSSIGLTEAA